MWFEYQTVKLQWIKSFTFANGQGWEGQSPPLMVSQIFTSTMQNLPFSQNFYFLWFFPKLPFMKIFLWVLHYDSGKQITRGSWSGIGRASSGIDPTGFGLNPTSIPPRVIVQKCLKMLILSLKFDQSYPESLPKVCYVNWKKLRNSEPGGVSAPKVELVSTVFFFVRKSRFEVCFY